MGNIFKAINILLSIGLVIIAGAIAYIAIPQFGNKALIVRSGSMEPTISVGSIVVVRAANSIVSPTSVITFPYGIGDIIAFRSEKNSKTIITHRVVAIEKSGNGIAYKTKGDANEEMDGWTVPQENILGKSYFVLPAFGKVLAFAKSKAGFPVLIIFPAAFVIILEIFNIFREVRRNRAPKEPEFSWSGFKILIPLLLIGISIPVAFAFPNDTETSAGNIFTAANDFGIATPSANTKTGNLFISDGYTCPTGALDTSSFKGTVSITKNGSLDITATLSGALAGTNYQLWVNQDPGACPLSSPTVPVFITTDGSGNGTNTLSSHGLVSGAVNFWVSLVGGTDVLRSTAVSF